MVCFLQRNLLCCACACACANAQLALEDLRAPPATARDGSAVSFAELKALVGLPKYHEDAKALAKRHAPSTVRRAACSLCGESAALEYSACGR